MKRFKVSIVVKAGMFGKQEESIEVDNFMEAEKLYNDLKKVIKEFRDKTVFPKLISSPNTSKIKSEAKHEYLDASPTLPQTSMVEAFKKAVSKSNDTQSDKVSPQGEVLIFKKCPVCGRFHWFKGYEGMQTQCSCGCVILVHKLTKVKYECPKCGKYTGVFWVDEPISFTSCYNCHSVIDLQLNKFTGIYTQV